MVPGRLMVHGSKNPELIMRSMGALCGAVGASFYPGTDGQGGGGLRGPFERSAGANRHRDHGVALMHPARAPTWANPALSPLP